MANLGRSLSTRIAGALLATSLLTGCHSTGTILFETSSANVENIQVDADSIYFIQVHGDPDLKKLPKAGGTPRAVASRVLYYSVAADAIISSRKGGSGPVVTTFDGGRRKEIVLGPYWFPEFFATNERVYWFESTSAGATTRNIVSMPRDGDGEPEVLVKGEENPSLLRADAAGNVFWARRHSRDTGELAAIRMLPAGGEKPITIVEASEWGHAFDSLVVDEHFVYADVEPGELHRVPRAGGPSEFIGPVEYGTHYTTLFDGTLYGCEFAAGRVLSLPATGGDLNEIATGHPESVAVDDRYVYWANAHFTSGGGEDDWRPREEYPASIARTER